jgi:tRNA-splicing ligase RtcB
MSRTQTNDLFNIDAANDSISHLSYFSGWPKIKRGKNKGQTDISESPLAYKKIDDIIERQSELIKPIVKLMPIGVMIGK